MATDRVGENFSKGYRPKASDVENPAKVESRRSEQWMMRYEAFEYEYIELKLGVRLEKPMLVNRGGKATGAHKAVKMQAHMHDKEINHLEREREREHLEAEKIRCHEMEKKQLDIQALQEEMKVLGLKLELAKLQAANITLLSSRPSGPSAPSSLAAE
ncbi:hypothetical protein EDD17DRAFT_1752146 [Pisolithus thermaeus]|nr:hypothetical protein EDD17DRAFT_1752146 [Pisolithus thermaeus]